MSRSRYGYEHNDGSVYKVMFVIFCLNLVISLTVIAVKEIGFNKNCSGYLKRAADANNISLAIKELKTAVSYIERSNLTSGYTSIIYRTPDEDLEFWYTNIHESLRELEKFPTEADPLTVSNQLMKLRETLLDDGYVTVPAGVSRFPNNRYLAVWGWISFLGAFFFGSTLFFRNDW